MKKNKIYDEKLEGLLKQVIDNFWKEDSATRERQVRQWKRLKLFWDGFQQVWYSEVAHDWRIWDDQMNADTDQASYDKPINVFRAYLESIIAALSVLVPPIKCYPDDADNPLDLMTAKAGDKIAELIFRHNDAQLLWLQALYIYCTEGMVALHTYTKESEEYGTYETKQYEDSEEEKITVTCSNCGASSEITEDVENFDEFNPNITEELCPECQMMGIPDVKRESFVVTKLTGVTNNPKSRQCMEVYGGLYVKIPNYARKQADIPYLIWSYETHYSLARERYSEDRPELREKIGASRSNGWEPYERMGRLNSQYQGEMPTDMVTIRNVWLRPAAFEILTTDECKELKKKFPNGAYVVMIDDICADYCNEDLDSAWTLTYNPLADYLYFNPLGLLLTSVQEITNDLVSLTVQTIEHGIPQTFADPAVLDFDAYSQTEATPGAIYPATPKPGGGSLQESFYEVRTATLSQEVLPFGQEIQSLGQMVTGALPSLFGGDIQGSKTASQYSMSRAQALQRLQNTWKMFTSWWKIGFSKVIPAYIKELKEDERFVQRDNSGNFINIFIRKAELEGKLGSIELEANENLPVTWNQRKDVIMQLMQANNPQILAMLASPENLPLIYEAIGITDFEIPGEDSRNKQYEEIKQLVNSEPLVVPNDPLEIEAGLQMGQPQPEEIEQPSVEVGEFDEHQIELQICIKWINGPAGQLAKTENPPGYLNVLLHARAHKKILDEMMAQQAAAQQGAEKVASPNKLDKEAPITGESDVPTN
jgi:hypothetical protein